MSYDPARALTESEIALLRMDGQFTHVRMVIVPQQTVLACKCAAPKLDNDAVKKIYYNTVTSGSANQIRNGMTGYVGSGSGLSDLGMVRIKEAGSDAGGTFLKFGRVSGIEWDTDVHVTIVDDFGIWAKLPTLDLNTIKMDDTVAYTDQNRYFAPTPVMGADTAIPYSAGSMVLDGTNSYCADNDDITAWEWKIYNAGVQSGSTMSGSNITSGSFVWNFPAPGSYVVELKLTGESGSAITTGHRSVYVYDDSTYAPLTEFSIDSMAGDREQGGWNAEITLWDDAAIPTVRDRAKVILIADDYYGGSAASFGQQANNEKVLMVGWISGESISYNFDYSKVKFEIQGAQYWLQQVVGPSTFLENINYTPTIWTGIRNLTMDKVVWHFMRWRSTGCEVLDVYRCNNSRLIGGMSASIGSIWEQMNDTATSRMLTYLCCDRHSRFFAFSDPQVLPSASRTSIPTLMELTDDDLTEQVAVNRVVVAPVALLEVAGLAISSGSKVDMYMSRAPGSLIYNRFGQNDQNDRLVVSSQADANIISGMLLAKKNNEWAQVSFTLSGNNHAIDIAPAMYLQYTLDTGTTVRGVSFTDKKFLVTRIEHQFDHDKGTVITEIECEGETVGIPGYTVIVPQEPIYNFPTEPDVPDIEYPIIPSPPEFDLPDIPIPEIPIVPPGSGSGFDLNGPWLVASFGGGAVIWSTEQFGKTIPLTSYEIYGRGSGSSGSGIYVSGSLVSGSYISGSAYYMSGSTMTYVPSWADYATRYEIDGDWLVRASGSWGELTADTVYPPPEYVHTDTDDWYEVIALDESGGYLATGVHDTPAEGAYSRSGTFYIAGSGVRIGAIQIKAKTWEVLASGSPTVGFSFLESYFSINTGDVNFSSHIASGSLIYSIIPTGYLFVGEVTLENDGYFSLGGFLHHLITWDSGMYMFHVTGSWVQNDYTDLDAHPWGIQSVFAGYVPPAYEYGTVYGRASEQYEMYVSNTSATGQALIFLHSVFSRYFSELTPPVLQMTAQSYCTVELVPTYKIVVTKVFLSNINARADGTL